jgi:flagellar motor switch protein FliN/FliY
MADENNDDLLNPEDIEALLNSASPGKSPSENDADDTIANDGDEPPADAGPESSAATDDSLDPSEIEALLNQGQGDSSATEAEDRTEHLLDQAETGLAAAVAPDLAPQPDTTSDFPKPVPFDFTPFENSSAGAATNEVGLDALHDVELDLRIELGRTELLIDEVLQLKEGAVVPLDKLAGDPVDILVNGRIIARGEVLVLNDNFCVRVAEILTPDG